MTAPSTAGKRAGRPAAATAAVPKAPKAPAPARPDPARLLRLLTAREVRLLTRLAAGEDPAAVAADLGLSPAAVRTRLHRAVRKLGVRTAAEAVALLGGPAAVPARARPVETPLPTGPGESAGAEAPERAGDAPGPATAPEPVEPPGFPEFYRAVHTRLVQQTFLLTACRHRAVHSAHLALGAASRQWEEVGALPDPEGWVRTVAFEAALSPWHRGGPRRAHLFTLPHRRIRVGAPGDERDDRLSPRDKALLKALRRLSRPRRRALVLHDALGLPARAVATEVESSSAAAAGRVRAARAALAREVPDLVGPDPSAPEFGDRVGELLHQAAVRGCPAPRMPSPALLTAESRLRSGSLTAGAALLSLAALATMTATLLGGGPSEVFRPAPPDPLPRMCSATDSGSAGPVLPGAQAGIRTQWCEVPGTRPVRAAILPPPAVAAASAAALGAMPVGVGCPPLRPCPTATPAGVPRLADRLH
ncbi:LuxR C-terminal-related transcriptional regulator [Kitasatospora sp. NPDC088346]|uniref:LuxR C-terminal-related transcriptional regulator n=1 Tax=Kitasatospora sp. NPDC088346 TaxID=3364073 RepID=UPI0037F404CE